MVQVVLAYQAWTVANQDYLAPNGFEAVQVAPVTEHILGYAWWVARLQR